MRSPYPKSQIKLKKPEAKVVTETGRRIYEGSLTSSLELSTQQEGEILGQMRVPIMPSSIVVSGLSPFNPHSVESVRRYVQGLMQDGLAEQTKEGFRLTEKGLTQSGMKPLAE